MNIPSFAGCCFVEYTSAGLQVERRRFYVLWGLAWRADGRMPSRQELIEGGVLRQMATSIPGISCAPWSSIISGKNPAEHAVCGFAEFAPRTHRRTFPNFDSFRREMLNAYRAVGH